MADLNTLRTHRLGWGRFVLSLFVVSWLSVSLQPCLMAMESGAEMAMESVQSAHAAHGADTASPDTGADCDHCPPAACVVDMSCNVEMSSECQPEVQCSLDSRRAKTILKDVQYDFPPGIAANIATAPLADHSILLPGIRAVAPAPGHQPPLNLLNCVFLI